MNGIYNAGNFDTTNFSKITITKYYGGTNSAKRFSIGGVSRAQGNIIDVSKLNTINYEIFNGNSNEAWYQLTLVFE